MINGTILILEELIFHFLMEMLLAPIPIVYTFRNLFVLFEYVLMLMSSLVGPTVAQLEDLLALVCDV